MDSKNRWMDRIEKWMDIGWMDKTNRWMVRKIEQMDGWLEG